MAPGGASASGGPLVPTTTRGAIKEIASNKFAIGCAVIASMGGFLFGYDQGVMSNLLTTENFGAQFPDIYSKADVKGWVVAVLQLGAWVGALVNGWFAQRFSRKYSMITAVCIFMVGSILQAAAQNNAYIFAGRAIGGFAIGMLSHVVPMYQSEISTPTMRGSLVSLQQFAITVGILVSFWLDYGFHYIGGVTCEKGKTHAVGETFDAYAMKGKCNGQSGLAWRIPLALQCVPAVIMGVGIWFYPFSPRWLASQGRNEDARKAIAKLRGLDPNHHEVSTELMDILVAVKFDEETEAATAGGRKGAKLLAHQYWQMMKSSAMRKRLAIGCTLQFFQQFTGINAIIYYAPTIFANLGLDQNTTSLLATGVAGAVNVVFTLPAIFFLDTFGRTTFLMIGAAGMGISHAGVATIMGIFKSPAAIAQQPWAGWLGVGFIYFFIANFAYSWGPIGWVLPSEIFPVSSRSKAMSITTSINWAMNAIVGRFTPVMIEKIGFGTYIVFGSCCALMLVWVWIFVPETKNRSLEEMDEVFGDATAAVDAERMTRIRTTITFNNVNGGDVEVASGLPIAIDEKAPALEKVVNAVHMVETAKTDSTTGSNVDMPQN